MSRYSSPAAKDRIEALREEVDTAEDAYHDVWDAYERAVFPFRQKYREAVANAEREWEEARRSVPMPSRAAEYEYNRLCLLLKQEEYADRARLLVEGEKEKEKEVAARKKEKEEEKETLSA